MHDTHPTRPQTGLQTVVTGVFGKLRFRARSGIPLRRHGTTPVLFVRARDARSLVEDSYGTESAC
ncbi:hypothetical protein GCM10010104_60430 [Streptomyces indiaensis]|uniref:Uncharacterized protein n=1 Tax=Streptomyces indiaensis TaxID=284033 RepID=A0ABP5RBU7_9ACTN